MTLIGVVTGSRAEARALPTDPALLVRCSGADASRTRAHTRELIRAGVTGLMSFGLAGGLDPALRPGSLVLPKIIVAADGSEQPLDTPWRGRIEEHVKAGGLVARSGMICGSDTLVWTPDAKRSLSLSSGAVAVDMESHVVAGLGATAGVPVISLRAVADPAERPLSPLVAGALDPEGRTRLLYLLRALLLQPREIGPLIDLAGWSRTALSTLSRALALLGPGLASR